MDIQLSIRLAMAHREIKACDLAERTGRSKSYISDVLNKKTNPSISFLSDVANALGYKTSELIALGE